MKKFYLIFLPIVFIFGGMFGPVGLFIFCFVVAFLLGGILNGINDKKDRKDN